MQKKKKVIKEEGNNPKPKTNTNPNRPHTPEIIVLSSSDDDFKTPPLKKPYRKTRKIKKNWAKHYKGEFASTYFHTHTFLTLNTLKKFVIQNIFFNTITKINPFHFIR